MKNISIILSVIALALIGVLFYQLRHHTDQLNQISEHEKSVPGTSFKIAYFEMDSVEAHYDYFKDAKGQLDTKQNEINQELSSLDRSNQKKVDGWRQRANTMTQAEGEQAQREYQEMQQNFVSRKNTLEQELLRSTDDYKRKIRERIENYLKEFNKDKRYSFIFVYEPGSYMYYRDSVYNVTPEIIQGLNSLYKKKN